MTDQAEPTICSHLECNRAAAEGDTCCDPCNEAYSKLNFSDPKNFGMEFTADQRVRCCSGCDNEAEDYI